MSTSKSYSASPEGKEIFYRILKMIDAMQKHYRGMNPREFITGIVIGREEYEILAGHLMNDALQPKYQWQATLPDEIQDIPLIIIMEPGIHIGVQPRYISLYGKPTL